MTPLFGFVGAKPEPKKKMRKQYSQGGGGGGGDVEGDYEMGEHSDSQEQLYQYEAPRSAGANEPPREPIQRRQGYNNGGSQGDISNPQRSRGNSRGREHRVRIQNYEDDEDVTVDEYGFVAPQQSRKSRTVVRKKTVRKIELYRGNLVLNCPVPDALLQYNGGSPDEEFNVMRYSAVTCAVPDQFGQMNFTLRP